MIFLSFADIRGTTVEAAKQGMKYALAKLYELHRYARGGGEMSGQEQAVFDSVSPQMPDEVAVLALKYLSDYLSRYYGRKVLIFLDEYDTPLQEAYVCGYWEEMAEFMLLACGYLKVAGKCFLPASRRYIYRLELTNMEVLMMFDHMVRDWFGAELTDRYELTSNRESGFGRYDIMLVPKGEGLDAMVIEFKVRKPKREASLEDTAEAAFRQIRDKKYDAALAARGFGEGRIRHYGFAFEGKHVLIREEQ